MAEWVWLIKPPQMAGDAADEAERRLLGRALAMLRARAQLSQEAAGDAFGTTGQNWQKYEAGKAPGVFQPSVQRRLTQAVGATVGDLMLVRDRLAQADGPVASSSLWSEHEGQLAEPGRGFRFDLAEALARVWGPSSRMLRMPDDSLRPWAASGATIVYDLELWPSREEGCVVQTEDGQLHVKLFLSADPAAVRLRELHPTPREIDLPRTPATGIYRVVARLDELRGR